MRAAGPVVPIGVGDTRVDRPTAEPGIANAGARPRGGRRTANSVSGKRPVYKMLNRGQRAHVAGGGDGTLNSVLQGLVGSKLPLGILPLGTANDLAKTLSIPTNLEKACEIIAAGHKRRIDVGRVNDVYYFNEASIGMSVALCRRLTKEAKSRFGVMALVVRAIEAIAGMRRFRALITLPSGETVARRTAQLTFGNGKNFGGLLATDEGAIDDRMLDLYSVEFERWTDYFDIVRALLQRRYDDLRSVYTLHDKFFAVKTGRRRHIEADGEIVASTPATFTVVPRAVEVFVPSATIERSEA